MTAIEMIKKLPETVDPAAIEGENTVFHFDLSGDDGGQVTLLIDNGVAEVKDGLVGEPKCVVEAKESVLRKVMTKDLNPMMALLTGKLKISSKGEMMKFASKIGMM